jgi:hypothetical protein
MPKVFYTREGEKYYVQSVEIEGDEMIIKSSYLESEGTDYSDEQAPVIKQQVDGEVECYINYGK